MQRRKGKLAKTAEFDASILKHNLNRNINEISRSRRKPLRKSQMKMLTKLNGIHIPTHFLIYEQREAKHSS